MPAYLQIASVDAWDTSPPEVPAIGDHMLNEIAPWAHVAMLKRWHESYGVELVAATAGQMELSVPRPPSSVDGAISLACEQYVYCPDRVQQELGSISGLAAQLLDAPDWRFWWD